MIDIEQAHEEWVLMEEPMGSFQTFIFAEYQKILEEVKRLRDGIQYWFDTIAHREDDVMVQYFKRLIE